MKSGKRIILLSSSWVHGHRIFEFAADEINSILRKTNVKKVLFIPYAQKDHDKYLSVVKEPFNEWGYDIESIHKYEVPRAAVEEAEAIFIGGGNTFRLLKALYENNLIDAIRNRVLNGIPYIGSSAGTNVATRSINTTNDMPIVYPPSFEALKLVPFNINPHYQDPDPNSTHKGETREQRISEFLELDDAVPVLGLREGSMLSIEGDGAVLKGLYGARLFVPKGQPKEVEVGTDLSFLLQPSIY